MLQSRQFMKIMLVILHGRCRQTVVICLVLPVRWLAYACKMPHETSVNCYQTSVRQVPHLHQTYMYTIHLTDIWWMSGICLVDIWFIHWYSISLVGIWYMSGVYVVLVWQLSGGSWQMSGGTSDMHLTIVWWSSDWEHQTISNHLAETMV